MNEKPLKKSTEIISCLMSKQKKHCSQIEGTDAFNLPESDKLTYCLNKCLVYKQYIKRKGKRVL